MATRANGVKWFALLLLACTPAGDSGGAPTAMRRHALTVTRAWLDAPIVGAVDTYETVNAEWDGQRYVVLVMSQTRTTCVVVRADGTIEQRVTVPFTNARQLVIDGTGIGHALMGNNTLLNLGRSCAGPFIPTPLPSEALRARDPVLVASADSMALFATMVVDGGAERSMVMWHVENDGGTSGATWGRNANWLNATRTADTWLVASQREVPNSNPVNVEYRNLQTFAVEATATLAKANNHQTVPQVAWSNAQVMVATGGGTPFSDFARRFTVQGLTIDVSDIDMRSSVIRNTTPNGFLLLSLDAQARGSWSQLLYSGSRTPPMPVLPDFDGGQTVLSSTVPMIRFGGSAPLLVAAYPKASSSAASRPLTVALAPNGPLEVLVPQVNAQESVHWSPLPEGGGIATWVDNRAGAHQVIARRYDSNLQPSSDAVAFLVPAQIGNLETAAFGDSVLVGVDSFPSAVFVVRSLSDAGLSPFTPLPGTFVVFTPTTIAASDTFGVVAKLQFDGATPFPYMLQMHRVSPDSGTEISGSPRPSVPVSRVLSAADSQHVYVATAGFNNASEVYRVDATGAPRLLLSGLGVHGIVRQQEGFCLLQETGFECRDPDGGLGREGAWPASARAAYGAFDGQTMYACLQYLMGDAWVSIALDGGVTELVGLAEPCRRIEAVARDQVMAPQSVSVAYPEGAALRGELALIDFAAVVQVDAGVVDGGALDAGGAGDSGLPELDAGELDAGELDAGELDAGELDAGELDAGGLDGGEIDSGIEAFDAGDANDAGTGKGALRVGCSCEASGVEAMLGALMAFVLIRRRRA